MCTKYLSKDRSHSNQLFCFIGAYVPLTKEGSLVVDGILASCYASFDHDLGHIAITPIQWFPEIIEWFFGGFPDYVGISKMLGRVGLPHGNTI